MCGERAADSVELGGVKTTKQKSKAAGKGKVVPRSVDEYLAGLPETVRSTLNEVRSAIRSVVPRETSEVISYGIPAFKYKRVLVWYAGFSNHCSLFPTASVIEAFKKELEGYPTSKGTIQFSTEKPLASTLIKKMVKERLRQAAD